MTKSNLPFYASIILFAVATLIVFSWMKDAEINIEKLEAKEVCIENHPYSNREWTQITCGKVVEK